MKVKGYCHFAAGIQSMARGGGGGWSMVARGRRIAALDLPGTQSSSLQLPSGRPDRRGQPEKAADGAAEAPAAEQTIASLPVIASSLLATDGDAMTSP